MYAPLIVTFRATQDVMSKLLAIKMEDTMLNHLDLRNYGTGIEGILFIFIAVSLEMNLFVEYCDYKRKKKEVIIEKQLPYHLVEQLSSEEILPLMAETYLNALPELDKLKIPDFDLPRFQQDVEQLFENQGWLVHQEA